MTCECIRITVENLTKRIPPVYIENSCTSKIFHGKTICFNIISMILTNHNKLNVNIITGLN